MGRGERERESDGIVKDVEKKEMNLLGENTM